MSSILGTLPFQRKILIAAMALSCAIFSTPSTSFAQASPCILGVPCTGYSAGDDATSAMSSSRACDADFMNQITAKATLEAQREMMVHQTHIAKPDSVLEYSCFDEMARNLALTVNKGEANNHIKTLALNPIVKFIDNNFGHTHVGGKISGDSEHGDEIGGATSGCADMQIVWDTAKCANLTESPFLSFEDIISGDPRTLPTPCSGSARMTAEIAQVAQNAAPHFKYAKMDAVETHLDLVNSDNACGDAIPTGVKYQILDRRKNKNARWNDEYICSNPSCYYDGKTCRE